MMSRSNPPLEPAAESAAAQRQTVRQTDAPQDSE